MLQGVSRRARVAAAELAGTRGDRKMCRETEKRRPMKMWPSSNISHHIFTTVSVSRHILMKKITSRPARVWRVTRSEPEATRATHRQETKTVTVKEEDVRVVMRTASNHKLLWTSSPSFSSLGGGKSDLTIASRLRHPTPSPPRTFPIGSHLVVRLTAAPPAPIEPLEPPLPIPHAPSRNLHEEVQRRAQSGELNKTRRHSNCPHGTK